MVKSVIKHPWHLLSHSQLLAQNAASLLSRRSNVTLLFVEGVHLLTESKFETESVTLSALTEFINATLMVLQSSHS